MPNPNPIQTEKFKAANRRARFGSPFSTARKCAGQSKQKKRACGNGAHYGLNHCRFHLTPYEKGLLAQRPNHKTKPKTKAGIAARASINAAPLELRRLPIFQNAGFWLRAELARAWQAGQAGDAREWVRIVGKAAKQTTTK